MKEVARTVKEIESMEAEASAWSLAGKTDVRSMTYEDGVSYALQWVLGNTDEAPIEALLQSEDDEEDGYENEDGVKFRRSVTGGMESV